MTTDVHQLGEVIHYLRGITFKPEDKVDPDADGAVVCMRTKNVQDVLDESDLIAVPSSLVRRDELYLREGDVLLSAANSWNLVGKVCRVPKLRYPATAGGFISVVRPRANVDSRYLYHWLSSPPVQEKVRGCARQTTNISNLSVPQFEQLQIPVPSVAEQHRIADILDNADGIRRRRKEALVLTEDLVRSSFLEMFGDPVANPKGWPSTSLKDVSELITDGEHSTPERSQEGVMLLSARNVQHGFIDLEDEKVDFVPEHEWERISRRCAPRRGDLLLSCSGTIGRVTVVRIDAPFGLVRSVATIRLDRTQALPDFVEALLATSSLQWVMQSSANQSAQANLFLGQISKLPVILPPISLQQRFVDLLAKAHRMRQRQMTALVESKALFASLITDAFFVGSDADLT